MKNHKNYLIIVSKREIFYFLINTANITYGY